MSNQFDAENFLRHLTHQPGVYRMYDESGDVIYVGKAKDLRKRVSSYFREKVDRVKTQVLVKQIADMDVTVTNTEAEALSLENTFIKKYRPRYNVLLRDDKSYPYIIMSDHTHPRLGFHRGARRQKGEYFGPFPNGAAVRESLRLMQKLFPIRQCEDAYYRARSRPCLQYQLKRCLAPCVNVCTDEEYDEQVQLARQFLNGKNQQVIDQLVTRMENASESLDFERAARYRDQIAMLRRAQERNSVTGAQEELDVIGFARGNGVTTVQMLFIRDNHLQGSRSYFPKVPADTSDEEVLQAFLLQFYLNQSSGRKTPAEIVLPDEIKHDPVLGEVLGEAVGRKVRLLHNVRGERKQYQQLAQKNAINALEGKLNQQSTMNRRTSALQQVLELGVPIQRMECFDISHTMGQQTVASCVVFDQNGPKKSDYRRYNITGITPGDDYAAMAKALAKRYDNAKDAGNIPDILFIDGGKGQLAQAENYFADWGKDAPMLIGVAKGESRKPGLETLIMAGSHETIPLSKDASALHLIQHIRDESHRFAITGHRQKRNKVKRTSSLEEIEGIGAKRRQKILKNLGGLQEVKNASIDQLANVPGISRALAEKIYYSFRQRQQGGCATELKKGLRIMKWNIPNILTSFRILLIPVFLIVFYLPFEDARFWSAFIFWLAAITDALDGWIARQFNQFTEFGAFLDPVADKAMVIAALVVLVEDYNAWYITVPALTMICRELIVSALREWMAQRGDREKVAVSNLGKLKTIAQMVALIGLLWDANIWTFWISIVLFFIAFVLTLWSMWEYLRAAGSQLTRN